MDSNRLPPPPDRDRIRIVFIGDIVGKPGLRIVCDSIPWLRQKLHAKVIIANAENAADGTGLRVKEYNRLRQAGVDAITLGDHIYRKKEIEEVLAADEPIVKPANFPKNAVGKNWCIVPCDSGHQVAVISLLGRVFMRPVDCPFVAADRVLEEIPADIVIRVVDFHAEATSDKQAMGYHLNGRVSAVLGTHTHVTTADEQILSGGTGFQCDVGMTGPYASILGREIAPVLAATIHFEPVPFDVACDDVRQAMTWFDVDPATGRCQAIGRLQLRGPQLQEWQSEQQEFRRNL